jgi:hypothetical protein
MSTRFGRILGELRFHAFFGQKRNIRLELVKLSG